MVSSLFSTMAVVALVSRSAPRGFAFSGFRHKSRYRLGSFRHPSEFASRSLSHPKAGRGYATPTTTVAAGAGADGGAAAMSTDDRANREDAASTRARTRARTRTSPRNPSKAPAPPSSATPNNNTPRIPKTPDQIFRARKSLEALARASKPGLDPSTNRFHPPLVYHEGYSAVPGWPPNHTFPMTKFERIAHAVLTTTSKTVRGSNLPRPLVRSPGDFFRPPDFPEVPIAEWLDLLNNHHHDDVSNHDASDSGNAAAMRSRSQAFGHRFLRGELTDEEARLIGFREQAHRPELVERTVLEVAGTVRTAQLALEHGIAANRAGGTHHAHPSGGAGFTILNDLAIASDLLTTASMGADDDSLSSLSLSSLSSSSPSPLHRRVDRVLVIDCDVHQGDGTAQYSKLWGEPENRLFTLSIHCESNYPFRKQRSTYDVGLPDGCGDAEYLEALATSVERALSEIRPHLVLYDAGVDVFGGDKLGRLDLSEEGGIRKRDRYVVEECVSRSIPVAAVVGGGYDARGLDALGRRHAILHEECAYVWRKHKLWKRELQREQLR